MEKSQFLDLINRLIVPLFTGSFIAGETESSSRDLEVALGKSNSVLLKPSKVDEYRFILKRGQPFKSFEVDLIRAILREISSLSELKILDEIYFDKLQNFAIEKAIIESVTETASKTIIGIISYLEKWAVRTYEGSNVSIGIFVNVSNLADENTSNVTYDEIMGKDFFAPLTDGLSSFAEFDRNGSLLGYMNLKKTPSAQSVSPYVYERVARSCNDKRIGVVLTPKGDILIFFARQLIFAKRNGKWCIYSHDEVIRLLYTNVSYTAKQIRSSIYNTALDCSFSYRGACIVYINKDKTREALEHIDSFDIVSEEHFEMKKQMELEEADKLYNITNAKKIIEKYSNSFDEFLQKNNCTKSLALRKIIAGRKLFELDRKLVEEMVSIDGATVIDYDGTIIAVGAIIKIEAGSQGGGRLAATTTLAKYGVAIKVSQDGIMQGFTTDKHGKLKQLFNVG